MFTEPPALEVASDATESVTPELLALTPRELSLIAAGPPKADAPTAVSHSRGAALWGWLRDQGPTPTLPATLTGCGRDAIGRIRLATTLPRFTVEETHLSADGTTKWRLQVGGSGGEAARTIETVLIPTPTRATVCISTQSGCTRFCDFCATARMGYLGAVSAGDMVGQVLLAMRHCTVPLTNVVMMGMGEPLDNLEAVLTAIRVLDEGLRISPGHVTVSTSGIVPKMDRLWKESRASLALSLHATTQELRDRLMPRVKRWPLTELTAWMREATAHDPRHVFIEYTLLDGVNDGDDDADRLADLLVDIRCRINLIPFNPTPQIDYRRPPRERVVAFRNRLLQKGYVCIIRETRGDDQAAACGQLSARPSAQVAAEAAGSVSS